MHSALRHVLAASAVSGVLVAASVWLFGCSDPGLGSGGRGCTLLAGVSGLELDLQPERAGSYDIVVRSDDGLEADCAFTVTTAIRIEWGTCKVRSGSAQPGIYGPDNNGLLVATDSGVAAVVDVTIFDAAANPILQTTLQPSYTDSYPNGRECDSEPSRYATQSLIVPGGEESM